MLKIKQNWSKVTLFGLLIAYLGFVVLLKNSNYFYTFVAFYLIISFILFFGTIVGIPGLVLHSRKGYKSAVPFYKKAIAFGTTNLNIFAAYGLILLRTYHPKEALLIFQKGISYSTSYLFTKTLNCNCGLCYWKLGDISKAYEIYETEYYFPNLEKITDFSNKNAKKAPERNLNYTVDDFVTLGYLAILLKDYEKAAFFSKAAIYKSEKYGPAYDNLGQIEYHKGNIDSAIDFFNKGLSYSPNMPESLYFLAKIAKEQNDIKSCKEYLNRIDRDKISGLSTITNDDIDSLV